MIEHASSPFDPFIGTVIRDAYRIEKKIGQGGMGAVYRAKQLSVDRDVVIKMLRSSDDPELNDLLEKRFKREALATSRLGHPNTISVLDFGQTEDGTLFLVLELLTGTPLNQILAREGPLDLQRVAKVGMQVCRSLNEAHEAGVIHRDLKPENVFLCNYRGEDDVVKVMDFGVARLMDPTDNNMTRITRAGLTVGTPMYIAPEQAMGQEVTPATDLYAFGVMLYEMLCGSVPFKADTGMEMALKHIREVPPPVPLDGIVDEIASKWQALTARLLLKDPKKRPQAAAEVADGLSELATLTSVYQTRPALAVVDHAPTPAPQAAIAAAPVPAATVAPPTDAAVSVPGRTSAGPWPWLAALATIAFLGLAVYTFVVDKDGKDGPPAAVTSGQAGVAPAGERRTLNLDIGSKPPGARVLWGTMEICKTTPCRQRLQFVGKPPVVTVEHPQLGSKTLSIEPDATTFARVVEFKAKKTP